MMPPGKRTARVQRTRGQLVVIESRVFRAAYELGSAPSPCIRWRTEVRGTPNHADESHQLVLPDGGTRGPGRLLPDRCGRPSTPSARPAQMQNGFLSENPEPCRPTDRDIEATGVACRARALLDGPARRAEGISGKTTVIVRWRSRDEAEDHAVPHGRTGDGLLHAGRLRHAVRDHPRLSRMPPVARTTSCALSTRVPVRADPSHCTEADGADLA